MKNYILIASLSFLILGSCGDQLREDVILEKENVVQSTAPRFLLAGSITSVGKWYSILSFEGDEPCTAAKYYQSLFNGGANTYSTYNSAPGNWNEEYDLLRGIQAGIDESEMQDKPSTKAAMLVLKSFVFSYLTDHYGDVPYSEAMQGRDGIFFPKFDEQIEIYAGMLTDLDEAVSILQSSTDDLDSTYDLIYNGDKSKWIRFANSLKIRLFVRSYEASNGANGAKLQAIVDGGEYFKTVMDNASFEYEGTNSYNSWSLSDFDSDGEIDYTRRKPTETFVNTLKRLDDPRINAWLAPVEKPWAEDDEAETFEHTDLYGHIYTVNQQRISEDGEGVAVDYPLNDIYVGSPVGQQTGVLRTVFGNTSPSSYDNSRLSSFSRLFREVANSVLPVSFIQADEVSFCLAEASAKGWISGDANAFYMKGIELNMIKWRIPFSDINDYLASADIQLDGSEDLERIATQKWLSLFTVGVEGYLDFRRTRLPSSLDADMPDALREDFPLRYRYPTVEASNNTENYDEAVSRQGADNQFTKIWLLK